MFLASQSCLKSLPNKISPHQGDNLTSTVDSDILLICYFLTKLNPTTLAFLRFRARVSSKF